MSLALVLAGAVLAAASGLPALARGRLRAAGHRFSTLLQLAAAVAGLAGAGGALAGVSGDAALAAPWRLAIFSLDLRLDGLGALFLLPIFLVSALGAVYGTAYWPASAPGASRLRLAYGLETAAMALVVLAADGISFLVAWELMALSAYFLVVADDRDEAAREAGWVYLAATHLGTLGLFGLFSLLHVTTGSFALLQLPGGIAQEATGAALFALALAGFGLKAGVVPLHVWLPGAHAAAPSHVSALLSGVLIKMGIYGLARVLLLFPDPPRWWGGTLLALGAASALLGVALALGQHDLKRLLAYHSVENIGIILLGLGLGLLGRATGNAAWVALGLGGALLHVLNHSLFKSLLFLGAGAVAHATGTREIDRLGGLGKRMPRTALCFLVGAVAISGLPPLNGFVSEWLVYLGFFDALQTPGGVGLAVSALAPVLALVGALALACFVKATGAVFLGEPREPLAREAHDPTWPMVVPMAVLALACFAIGLAPQAVVPALEAAVAAAVPGRGSDLPPLAGLARLGALSGLAVGLLALLLLLGAWLRARTRRAPRAVTWDCGYARPTPRLQYTASSFAATLVGTFRWALLPVEEEPRLQGHFPPRAHFHSVVPDLFLDRLVLPALRRTARLTLYARYLQQGRLQLYLLYVGLTLLVLLLLV